jgi:hypothetical protein
MTAAETLSRAEQRATLFLHSGRVLLAIAAVAVLAGSFYAGSAHRGRKDADAIYAATHKRQMDTIRVIETQYQKDTVRVTVTKEVAAKARETFAAAATTIEQAADTSTTGTLPISLVMPEVQACKSALASDSLAYQAVAAALVTMTLASSRCSYISYGSVLRWGVLAHGSRGYAHGNTCVKMPPLGTVTVVFGHT